MMTVLSLMMPLAASMESMLRDIEFNVLASKLGAVTNVGISLAAACVAISMIGISTKYLRGTQFDWMLFARPSCCA